MKVKKAKYFERIDFLEWIPIRATYVFNVKEEEYPYINEAITALNKGW